MTPATDEQYMYQQYLEPGLLQQFYGAYWDPYMFGGYAGMMDPSRWQRNTGKGTCCWREQAPDADLQGSIRSFAR